MKLPPRISFELLDFNCEIIMNLSPTAYDFAHMWTNYLQSCGWSEEDYELEMEKRIFFPSEEN